MSFGDIDLTSIFSSYIEIFSTLLIFGIGIPSFITQTIIKDDLKTVINNQRRPFVISIIIYFIIISLIGLFIYALPRAEIQEWIKYYLFAILLIISLFVVGVFAVTLAFIPRKRMVNYLKRKIIRRIKNKRNKNNLIEDLKLLGVEGKLGYEKNLVIKALREIIKCVQSKDNYSGNELEDLIRVLKIIMRTTNEFSNLHNILDIISEIVNNIKLNKEIQQNTSDIIFVMLFIKEMSIKSIRNSYDFFTAELIEIIVDPLTNGAHPPISGQILFDIGSCILDNNSKLFPLQILRKFERLISVESCKNYYYGYVVKFWKKFGNVFMLECSKPFSDFSSRDEVIITLKKSQNFLLKNGEFETAKLIDDFIISFHTLALEYCSEIKNII